MKIAICDDDNIICTYIEKVILSYAENAKQKVEIDIFNSGQSLFRNMERDTELLFLDIELKDWTGIEIGHFLREKQNNLQIVFISAYPEYALELFKVRPMDFLVKPFTEKDIIEVVETYKKCCGTARPWLSYQIGRRIERMNYDEILYLSSNLRKVMIHRIDGKNEEVYGKLDEFFLKLPPKMFWQIHKSYVVNVRCVRTYCFDRLILNNGEELPVSKAYRKEIRQKMLEEEMI